MQENKNKKQNTTEQYYLDAFTTTQQGGRLGNTMQHDIRAKEDRSLFFSALQHRAQLAPTGLLETSTVMLLQKHTMPLVTFLAKRVTHVVSTPISSCLSECSGPSHDGAVEA